MAREDPQSYPGIGEAITAVLFLGTPHQGSSSATYGKVLGQTLNTLVIGSQASRFTGPVRTELLRSLRTYDRELLNIAQDFSKHTADIKIRSFIEGKSMKGMNHRVSRKHQKESVTQKVSLIIIRSSMMQAHLWEEPRKRLFPCQVTTIEIFVATVP